jgi:pimeloyl-ACP methyl ester carboxylesterase
MQGEPKEKQFQASGARIAYWEWGSDAGPDAPVVLLVHATGFHARCWDKTVEALPTGTRVIAIDQRGHGRSENTGKLEHWALPADDLVELIEALDLKDIIGVGHSMGGHGIAQAAARLPDRFERLLLVDPVIMNPEYYAAIAERPSVAAEDHPVARRRNQWTSWEEMFERFKDRHPYSLWRADILEDYCRYGLLPKEDGEGLELACEPLTEASIYAGSAGTDIYDMIRTVKVPVTVLRAKMRDFEAAAEMDFAASPTWEGLAGEFPNGTDVYRPDLSHFIPMQEPELVAEYIAGK